MMTLYEVVHGVAFAQAFNFYLQERRLIPPSATNMNGKVAFVQDLEDAQEYAHAQADLTWVRYQKFCHNEGWADETTNTYIGKDPLNRTPATKRPTTRLEYDSGEFEVANDREPERGTGRDTIQSERERDSKSRAVTRPSWVAAPKPL
jgi:hypothetical protein